MSDTPSRWDPFWQLTLCRIKEFFREPEAIFWVYGFPLLMTLVLGIAFREKKADEQYTIDIEEGPHADFVQQSLKEMGTKFIIHRAPFAECKKRLRGNKTSLIVQNGVSNGVDVTYLADPVRPESSLAQKTVDDVLQKARGRTDILKSNTAEFNEPGGRYIDFLVPGLLGMGMMGGGMFGVGFAIVDMRIRKLLKRFLATPMRRPDFLMAVMASRFVFMLPEVLLLLLFAYFFFDVRIVGSVLLVTALIVLGGITFSGIGLLVACRAKTLEAASGLMNLVMLPMWVLSGVFFDANRYPEAVQPLIRSLPLTLMNDALRAVMNEGAGLMQIGWQIVGLILWGLVTFLVALKLFRWQ